MIIYFADRLGNVLRSTSSKLSETNIILSDSTKDDIATGVKTLELTLTSDKKLRSEAKAGNLIMQGGHNGKYELFTIIDSDYNSETKELEVYAEDAGLDLLNSYAGAWEATAEVSLKMALDTILGQNHMGWAIQYNGIDPNAKKGASYFKYSSEETVTARMISVLKIFDAEMFFSYEIDGLNVIKRFINITKKRGDNAENIKQLYLNKDIEKITEKNTIKDLQTVCTLYGIDKDSKKQPLNKLPGYSAYSGRTIKPTDGDFTGKRKHTYKVSGNTVQCVDMLGKWASVLDTDGKIERVKETNQKTAKDAISDAITALEKVCDIVTTYDVKFSKIPDIEVGNSIHVIDEHDRLYLKTRVLSTTSSEIAGTFEATFGDFSEVEGSKAEVKYRDIGYVWIVYADNDKGFGISLDPSGKSYMGIAINQKEELKELSQIKDLDLFKYMKFKGNDGLSGYSPKVKVNKNGKTTSISVTDEDGTTTATVNDGEKGDKGETGEKGEAGDKGEPGNGIKSSKTTYQVGISPVTPPTGTWSDEPVATSKSGQFLWSKTVLTYTNETESAPVYSVSAHGEAGEKGKDGTSVTITSKNIEYQIHSSGTITPTGEWTATIPDTNASKPFLWCRTTVNYSTGVSTVSYSVGSTLKGVKVGGRNLLLNSKNGGRLYTPTQYLCASYSLSDSAEINTETIVTLTINYTASSERKSILVYFGGDSVYVMNWDIASGGTFTQSKTFNITKEMSDVLADENTRFINIYSASVSGEQGNAPISGTCFVNWIKLETGNIATEYTQAPEDYLEAIGGVEALYQNLQTDVNYMKNDISNSISDIRSKILTNYNELTKFINEKSLIALKKAVVVDNSLKLQNEDNSNTYLLLDSEILSLVKDGQDVVTIDSYKGEGTLNADNSILSTIRFKSTNRIGNLGIVSESNGHVSIKEVY